MKIVIPLAAPFGRQGGWRVISKLPTFWIAQGHEVFFLTPDGNAPYFPTDAKFLYFDNKGNITDAVSAKNWKNPLLGAFHMRKALELAINKISADILLATHSFTAGPVKRAKIKAEKFYYVQAYEPEMYDGGPFWYKIYKEIARRSYAKNLEIIVNSHMYFDFKEIKSDKVVYPGLDLNIFKPQSTEKLEEIFILGTVGRSEEYKGTRFILEAFKELRQQLGPKIELHVAFGDAELSATEGIKVITPSNDQELALFYQSLHAYVCAGTIQLDAVHYPVIEAMACGIPLITTGYYPADEKNAWMVPIKDSTSITKCILHVMQNSEEAQKKVNEAQKEVNNFSWENVSSKMLNYFKAKLASKE